MRPLLPPAVAPSHARLLPALAGLLLSGLVACGDSGSPAAPSAEVVNSEVSGATVLTFSQITAGGSHTCGVTTEGVAYCWGYNFTGQLGLGSASGPEVCGPWPCARRPRAGRPAG